MKIRKAKLSDVNQLYSLMKFNKELEASTDKIYFSKNHLKIIIKSKNFFFIIAEENKNIIGVLGALLFWERKTSYLDFIFLNKEFRGKGFGKDLYNFYISYLRKNRMLYLWTFIEKNDYNLQKINNKFGMKKRGLYYFYDKELK